MNSINNSPTLPFVSVVMPVRNEDNFLYRSLSAVLSQDYPSDRLQIIVADGISSDGTQAVINQFLSTHPNLILTNNPGLIVPTGLNKALKVASGEIIVRVDGHTIIAPDYVSQCVSTLQRSGADNVGGRMTANGQGAFAEAVAVATSSPFGVGGARFHYSKREELVDTVYMGAWWKKIFEKIGLFDEELVHNQDDEFNYRLLEKGGKILLNPEIKSVYSVRRTPSALWQQYFQYGYWKVRVLQKHFHQMRLRQFIPPIFVASLLLASGLALITPAGFYLLILIFGSYLIANLFASMMEGLKTAKRHILWLPIVYLILHLSYGSGFLVGMIRFANRWGDKKGKVPELLLGE